VTSTDVRICRSLDEAKSGFGPCALSIGNFDGVHAGHRRILARVVALAAEHGWKPSVITFDPHPAKVLSPGRAPRLLATTAERCRLLAEQGIRQILLIPFDERFSLMRPEEFAQRVLVDYLDVKVVVVGEGFRFGHRQSGNVSLLRELGGRMGFLVEGVKRVSMRGHAVSSTAIRRLLESGEVSRARRLLCRPYALEGAVVTGRGIGSRQTVPTLNLATNAELVPSKGVYVTRTTDVEDGRRWPSITNVGFRPTFGGHRLTVETFLLEALKGATPAKIMLEFLLRLRDERKFPDPATLKVQILHDAAQAQAYFRRLDRFSAKAEPEQR
jgi:riboflavin kinase / FMN adenylyltransferase